MRNFAVKFAILSANLLGEERVDPSIFLDLEPIEALQSFKLLLSEKEQGIALFGFSDLALLSILDEEFEVDMDSHRLLFRKTFLDARSIRLAGSGRASDHCIFTHQELTLIDNLSIWLLDATRSLYRADMSDARIADIRREYAENFRAYALKSITNYEPGEAELLLRSLFASIKAMNAFCHSLTVDAMFKADAAKVVFGENSGYYQAWFRKQIFRHMMSKAVNQYLSSCVV